MPTINNNNENLEIQKRSLHGVRRNLNSVFYVANKKMHPNEDDSIWVIDRFEENFAICENRKTREIKKINIKELPQNLKEGNVLRLKKNKYNLDLDEEKIIKQRISEKMKNIWND